MIITNRVKFFLEITCDRINYSGYKICNIFIDTIKFWIPTGLVQFSLFQFVFILDFENVRIYIKNQWLTKRSDFFFKYLSPQISLKNYSVLKMNLWISGFKWNWPQPWFLFIFGKNKQTPWCNLLKCFKKIASWFLPDFSLNQKPPWLSSVSFETLHPKVRFEHKNIF